MKTSYLIALIVVIVLVGAGLWYVNNANTTTQPVQQQTAAPATNSGSVSATASVTATPVASQGAAPAAKHFMVNGNDATADVKTITVAAGTPVTITFGADAGTTYHGGLDFRSSVVNTGTIAPGSTKSVSFTATKSFAFTPYWPATDIAKPYTINVVVN